MQCAGESGTGISIRLSCYYLRPEWRFAKDLKRGYRFTMRRDHGLGCSAFMGKVSKAQRGGWELVA